MNFLHSVHVLDQIAFNLKFENLNLYPMQIYNLINTSLF